MKTLLDIIQIIMLGVIMLLAAGVLVLSLAAAMFHKKKPRKK